MAKLVVFFSRADENYFGDSIRYVTEGNTAKIAKKIAELTKGELFQLVPAEPYAADYETCTKQAMADLQQKNYPALAQCPDNLDDYDEIYLGVPNYFGTLPMPVMTFLNKFSWQRKRIFPFVTHEGSGIGMSEKDLRKACKGAMVMKGLAVQGSNIEKVPTMVDKEIERWLLYSL